MTMIIIISPHTLLISKININLNINTVVVVDDVVVLIF